MLAIVIYSCSTTARGRTVFYNTYRRLSAARRRPSAGPVWAWVPLLFYAQPGRRKPNKVKVETNEANEGTEQNKAKANRARTG